MANGIPLDDSDRVPWLVALHDLISSSLRENKLGVLACSALKERYRHQLMEDNVVEEGTTFTVDLPLYNPEVAAGEFPQK